jgi:HlyD family secretion protein
MRSLLYKVIIHFCVVCGLLACGTEDQDQDSIQLSGSIEAREVKLAFQVGGQLNSLDIEEGEPVKVNQLIARIDNNDYQFNLQRTQFEAKAAEATLLALRNGTRPQELEVGKAELVKAQAQVRFSEAEVKRIAVLVADKLASDEALEKSQLEFEHALASEDAARHRLALLQEGPRQEDIQHAEAQYNAYLSGIKLAKKKLIDTQLLSPLDGYVTAKLSEAGEVVSPGQAIVKVAELSTPWVRAYLAEPYLSKVKLGQAVDVKVDGLPNKTFSGKLIFISPKAEFTPKTVETQALRVDLVYRIKVQLQNPNGELKIGMPADIFLPLSES